MFLNAFWVERSGMKKAFKTVSLTPPVFRWEFERDFFFRVFSLFYYCSKSGALQVFRLILLHFWMFPNHRNIFDRFYDFSLLFRYAKVFSAVSICDLFRVSSVLYQTDWFYHRWWIYRWTPFRYRSVLFLSWTEMLLSTFLETLLSFQVCVLQIHTQTSFWYIHLLPSIDTNAFRPLTPCLAGSCTALL